MQIDREVLDDAVARGELTPAQAESLYQVAARRRAEAAARAPAADLSGWRPLAAIISLAVAAALLLLEAFDHLGFPGLAGLATALALALFGTGWQRYVRSGGTRGHVLLVVAVLLAPLAAHGVARTLGLGRPFAGFPSSLLDWLTGPWFPVQATAAVTAGLALRTFRIPFLAVPITAALWFAVQDAAPILFGGDPSWPQRALLSALCGVVFIGAGIAVERRTHGDLAFWLHLPGLLALCGGLLTWPGATALSLLLVAVVHLGLVLASLLLGRRSFAVAGALGIAASLGRLADDQLNAVALSFALAAVALGLVGLGLLYHLHAARLAAQVHARLPRPLQRLLPPVR